MNDPRNATPQPSGDPSAALDYEIAQEKAATMGRLGRQLEAALAALAAFDAGGPSGTDERRGAREALVAQASLALWHFIVQREACGLADAGWVMRDYAVPNEVRARMGVFPKSPGAARG